MTFTVNADCTALKKDMTTSVLLKQNESHNSDDFYAPSLVQIATNGRIITKNGKEIVEYSPSINLDITKLDVAGESVNSFATEIAEAKADKSKQPK